MPEYDPIIEPFVDQWFQRGSRGRAGGAIDDAPLVTAELAGYFAKLPIPRLAGAWVACVVDAVATHDCRPADMARALIVVAERLHGVTFPQPVPGALPMTQAQRPPVIPPKAAPNGAPKPSPAEIPKFGKYEVFTGEPPAEKAPRARASDGAAQASVLAPGGWFIWTDAPKTANCKVLSEKWSKQFGFVIVIYRSTAGKVVVKRPKVEGEAS